MELDFFGGVLICMTCTEIGFMYAVTNHKFVCGPGKKSWEISDGNNNMIIYIAFE